MDETNISFKTLESITKGSIAMQVVLISATVLMTWNDWHLYEAGDVFLYLVPAVLIAALLVCSYLDNTAAAKIDYSITAKDKLASYVRYATTKLGLLEGAGTFAIILLFVKSSSIYFLYFMIAFVAFIVLRPTRKHFVQLYRLSREEQEVLGIL